MALGTPPLAELAATAAKGWLLALLEDRPLSASGEIRVSALAQIGPELCHAVLRALTSEEELEWLAGSEEGRGLAAQAVELGGVDGARSAVEAVEALRRGLRDALGATPAFAHPAAAAAVVDRLSHVCAALAATAVAVAEAGEPADPLAGLAAATEKGDGAASARAGADAAEPASPAFPRPLTSVGRAAGEPPSRPLWMAALERQLAEGGRSGRRFALLLIDVDGADRLRLAEPGPAVGGVLRAVGRAVREHVRRADLLAHEDDGRMWVIAPDAGRVGGRALAARLSEAVQAAGRLRGASLSVSIGLAFYPDDGRDAVALTEHAEEQMFAARASGIPVADGTPEPVGGGFSA